jgi:hypothetical protein
MAKKAKLELSLFFYENPSYSLDSHTYVIPRNQKQKNKKQLSLRSTVHYCVVELKLNHMLLRGQAQARPLFLQPNPKIKIKNHHEDLGFFMGPSSNFQG